MLNKICCICLSTEENLVDLEGDLLNHYELFMNNSNELHETYSAIFPPFSCYVCKEELSRSLDLKNKCAASHKILCEWSKNYDQKQTIDDKELLKKSLDSLTKLNYQNNEKKPEKYIENITVKILIDEKAIRNNKLELVKCEDDKYDENNERNLNKDKCVNDIKNDRDDYNDDDDDMFLINGVDDKNTVNKKKKGSRVYPRKGISEYSKYETVFDIELFKTDEDARKELMSRRHKEPYQSAQYRCELCYTVYKCEKLLLFHMKWHNSEAPHSCHICRMRFATKKAETVHRAKCHRGKFSCRRCPLITYYGSAMQAHFEKHDGKTYVCHCGAVFKHISSFQTHARTVHITEHVCLTCARTFLSEKGLACHRTRAHQDSSEAASSSGISCPICSLQFPTATVYNVHVLNGHRNTKAAAEIIACRYCGEPFETQEDVKKHKTEKHARKKHVNDIITCDLCGAKGVGHTWRYFHYSRHHPDVDYNTVSLAVRHMCDQCGRLFGNVTNLRDHLNVHKGLKPHACADCGVAFATRVALTLHSQRHRPPLVCPRCTKQFRTKANFYQHMRIHTGERRYVCGVCSKTFLHKHTLKDHERAVHCNQRRVRKPRQTDKK